MIYVFKVWESFAEISKIDDVNTSQLLLPHDDWLITQELKSAYGVSHTNSHINEIDIFC